MQLLTNLDADHRTMAMTEMIDIVNGAHILYPYTDEEQYLRNVLSFITSGLKLGHAIIYNDNASRHEYVRNYLKEHGYTQDEIKSIVFRDNHMFFGAGEDFSPSTISKEFAALVDADLVQGRPIRMWGDVVWKEQQKDICAKLSRYELDADRDVARRKTLTVCAYRADNLSAAMYVELMKSHQYIMTDHDLFYSSLCTRGNKAWSVAAKGTLGSMIAELEKYRQEAQKLDRLETISRMASIISHEVRNPMTTVRGFLQLFRSKEIYKEDHEFMDLMIEEIDRANTLIKDFLSLSKPKRTKLVMQDLNQIIESILPMMQASAIDTAKSVVAELTPIPQLPLDRDEMRQVLLNLVNNGLDAMAAGGTVTIKTYSENGNIVLSIADQGIGIPKEILSKLGTPFVTTKENGTGLGLATSYRILERHHAQVHVQTGRDGTTFYIRFPTTA